MTILIALAPGQRDDTALRLGVVLARTAGEDIRVASVVARPWPPSPFGADKDFLDYQEGQARHALERAEMSLRDSGVDAQFVLHQGESVAGALLEVLDQVAASTVVLGSSSAGPLGRVLLGGVAERVLHGATVPVVVAPRGYDDAFAARIGRVVVAVGKSDEDSGLLERAAELAFDYGARLRVVCFVVRPLAMVAAGVQAGAEQLVVHEWAKRLEEKMDVDIVIGQGGTWPEAVHDVDWAWGDLCVIGVNSGPLSRFFLGSHAAKIVRNSSVPTLLLPRR